MRLERRRFGADGSVILGLRVGAARAMLWCRRGECAFAKAYLDIGQVHLSAGVRRNVHLTGADLRPAPRLVLRFEVRIAWCPADRRRWRVWDRSVGVRELIDMRPFGLFLERPANFVRRG